MNKHVVIQAYNGKPFTNRKEQTTGTHMNINESQAIILRKEARPKSAKGINMKTKLWG